MNLLFHHEHEVSGMAGLPHLRGPGSGIGSAQGAPNQDQRATARGQLAKKLVDLVEQHGS